MSRNLRRLLDFIGAIETAPPTGNYNALYGEATARGDLSQFSLNRIIELQTERLRQGVKSTAIGKYQFLRQTLRDLMRQLGLTGEELFTPDLQDRLATTLLERRGLNMWLDGRLSDEGFANNLAMEWASLPVVTPMRGAHRQLEPGQSYYAGDALNRALTTPMEVMDTLRRTRAENERPPDAPPDVDPAPPVEPPPGGFFSAIANLFRRIFG